MKIYPRTRPFCSVILAFAGLGSHMRKNHHRCRFHLSLGVPLLRTMARTCDPASTEKETAPAVLPKASSSNSSSTQAGPRLRRRICTHVSEPASPAPALLFPPALHLPHPQFCTYSQSLCMCDNTSRLGTSAMKLSPKLV